MATERRTSIRDAVSARDAARPEPGSEAQSGLNNLWVADPEEFAHFEECMKNPGPPTEAMMSADEVWKRFNAESR